MTVPCKLYHRCSSYHPGYPCDLLGIPIDLEYQLRNLSVYVPARKMGIWI